MNDAAGAGRARGGEDIAGARDVGGIHGSLVDDPETVVGGDMIDLGASPRGAFERGAIAEVAARKFALKALEPA